MQLVRMVMSGENHFQTVAETHHLTQTRPYIFCPFLICSGSFASNSFVLLLF